MLRLMSLLGLALLPGCSTLINGSNQSVSVATAPVGASCAIDRAGERLGSIGVTPGNLTVSKSKKDLLITCDKDGYRQASLIQPPKFVATTVGNLIAGGLVGLVVDASSGANYVYPAEVHLDLAPSTPAVAAVPSQGISASASGTLVPVSPPSPPRPVGS